MTPRENVLAAVNQNQPERVPLDFSGHRSSGIAACLYPALRKALGLPANTVRVYDLIQQLAIVDEDVLDLLGVDTVELGRGFALEDSDWVDWTLPDGTACEVPVWAAPEREGEDWVVRSGDGRVMGKMPPGALYFEQVHYPLAEASEFPKKLDDAFDHAMWMAVAAPPGPVSDEQLKSGAVRFRETTDRAILGLFGGNLLESGQILCRNDVFLLLLAAEPVKAHNLLDSLVERHLSELQKYLDLVGDCLDIIVFGDDLGMQTGPQISPEMYREFFKPRHEVLWNRAKELADVKVMLHCCGGVRELIPDLIEAGLDAMNPVQISSRGMAAAELKREFGSELTFWGGGCDTHYILPRGSPEEVARHVREQVSILRPGGGFVFQQVHNILADVPVENIVAMFEALNDER